MAKSAILILTDAPPPIPHQLAMLIASRMNASAAASELAKPRAARSLNVIPYTAGLNRARIGDFGAATAQIVPMPSLLQGHVHRKRA